MVLVSKTKPLKCSTTLVKKSKPKTHLNKDRNGVFWRSSELLGIRMTDIRARITLAILNRFEWFLYLNQMWMKEDDYNRLVAPWSMLGFYRGKEVFLHGMKLPSVGFAWRSGITCEMWWWRSVGEGEGAEFFCRFSAVGVLWNVPSMVGVEKEEVLCMLNKCPGGERR